jgi:hypothetical protein
MASMKLKIAYVCFFASFVIWLSLFFYICFPSGVWSTPIRFPDSSSFILFFGSAIVAVVSCLLISLNNIGLYSKLRTRSKEVPETPYLNTPTVSQISSDFRLEKEEPTVSIQEEKHRIIVLPQLEEKQEVPSTSSNA